MSWLLEDICLAISSCGIDWNNNKKYYIKSLEKILLECKLRKRESLYKCICISCKRN